MSATRDRGIARNRARSAVMVRATATLALCFYSSSKTEEQRDMCEHEGETLAIHDCEIRLFLWARRQAEPMPPLVLSDRQLCRLVVSLTRSSQTAGSYI